MTTVHPDFRNLLDDLDESNEGLHHYEKVFRAIQYVVMVVLDDDDGKADNKPMMMSCAMGLLGFMYQDHPEYAAVVMAEMGSEFESMKGLVEFIVEKYPIERVSDAQSHVS